MDSTRIIIAAVVAILGLLGTLLHLRNQRKQAEVRQKTSVQRADLQRQVDKLKKEMPGRSEPK